MKENGTEKESSRSGDVESVDALGKISERTRSSRLSAIIIAVVALFLGALLIGMILRSFSGDIDNTPDIPRVEI